MTHEQLIAEARKVIGEFGDSLRDDGRRFTPPDALTEVRMRETVTIYFTRDSESSRAEVCLDRETGELVGATYSPETSHDNAA